VADLVLAKTELLDELALTGTPDGKVDYMKMFALEEMVKKVFKNGTQVVPAPKKKA
jgi:hypothetical protein